MTTEEDAQTAALQEYFDSNRPSGYGAAFRAGWDAATERIHRANIKALVDDAEAQIEIAESVAQMAAHDRDEALEQAARFEQDYARLEDLVNDAVRWIESACHEYPRMIPPAWVATTNE